MAQPYCYWSVADGGYVPMMERCVASARQAGVFKEFHVFTDTPIEGCECYDCQSVVATHGMFKLVYMKAGLSKLLFDYFVWIDADTVFRRNPWGILSALGKAPIHVPLVERNPSGRYEQLLSEAGVFNRPYSCNAAFWMVKREAIDRVHDLALHFLGVSKKAGYIPTQDEAIGYAMQMLCADPAKHKLERHSSLWSEAVGNWADEGRQDGPAILHLGRKPEVGYSERLVNEMEVV